MHTSIGTRTNILTPSQRPTQLLIRLAGEFCQQTQTHQQQQRGLTEWVRCVSLYLLCRDIQILCIGLVHLGQSAALIVLASRKWPLCSHPGILLLRPSETLDSDTAAKSHIHTHIHTHLYERVDRGEIVVSVVCFLFPPAVLMPLHCNALESTDWPKPDLVALSRKGKRWWTLGSFQLVLANSPTKTLCL